MGYGGAFRRRIADFFPRLRKTAEQLTPLERWYRILSEALKKFLRGRILVPPRQLQPAGAASYEAASNGSISSVTTRQGFRLPTNSPGAKIIL